ncbi:HpcH/HpaI aldolase/citrate lyase family protein [Donghicola tyrosinivorans]|uniref:Citrate lyase subunit beta/citryl-CoA lyase n=1 Tax=Donghicola tyrosinivorans TaxID=1652492 RepID=A0A2T0WED5_9RHOB|nr:CoA ester lyase [Donghicola tyrosinivorans]PRY85067.1 citrate lyase subunit beta/citryl-CoA lyase [Donghicola tyrosinivorans]
MVTLDALRTALFVPATRPDRFAKAAASGADAIILDLEDAVLPDDKDAARANLSAGFDCPVIVRINATGTPWHKDDCAAVAALDCAAVMVPKAEDPETLRRISETTGKPLVALIETALGMANARAIAQTAGVVRLAFGSVDYCADLGCDHTPEALLTARSELVLAARLGGLAGPLDGVTTRIDDPATVTADAARAKALGMSGKLCIHPAQIAPATQAFRPDAAQIAWATRVLAASEGAARVDGEMVDEPVRLRARAILAGV